MVTILNDIVLILMDDILQDPVENDTRSMVEVPIQEDNLVAVRIACSLLRSQTISLLNDLLKILDSRGAIPSKTVADVKVAIQEMAEYSQKWHNGTSRTRSTETFDGLAAIQAQLNNLGREIKKVNEKVYDAQAGCKQYSIQRNNANPSYQERRQSMEDTLSKFMSESAKRHEENSNLIKEIRASTDAAIRN
ncbi:hypothetical protein Tco_1466827 [Tanacetum coccineum]